MSWDRLYERLAWVARSGEPARCRHLLSVLALHAADDDGSCWVSIGTLAAETGLGTTSVRRAIGDLVARGVIVAPDGRKGGGRGAGTRYLVPEFVTCLRRGRSVADQGTVSRPPPPRDDAISVRRVIAPAGRAPTSGPAGRGPRSDDAPQEAARVRGASVRERGTAAPDRIDLDERLLAIAREAGLSAEQARRELDACVDWHRANGRRRVDWQATARNWLRKSAQLGGSRPAGPFDPGVALPRPSDHGAWQSLGQRFGLQARPGEEWAAFQARVRANVERAREV
jgi:hypothetical protein